MIDDCLEADIRCGLLTSSWNVKIRDAFAELNQGKGQRRTALDENEMQQA